MKWRRVAGKTPDQDIIVPAYFEINTAESSWPNTVEPYSQAGNRRLRHLQLPSAGLTVSAAVRNHQTPQAHLGPDSESDNQARIADSP
jgi:hypothetical protein